MRGWAVGIQDHAVAGIQGIHFYRGLSGTEDDCGGLQWDFISRCIAVRPKVHHKKGRQNYSLQP